MNKIYKMVHSGNEYYVDESGIRKYYFDMLVNDINERDFDTIEWLDGTRDLDSQLDFIRFTKYGDFKDIIKSLKTSENIDITELKTYEELLQFYVDYLNGKITDYYLYDNVGTPWYECVENMLLVLNACKERQGLSDYDVLCALIDTNAYEIEDFEELTIQSLKNILKKYEDFFEDFNTRVHSYTSGNDKTANICVDDSKKLDKFLHLFRLFEKNL
jgi:hypothetical protein